MPHPFLFVAPSAATRRQRARDIVRELPRSSPLLLLSKEQESADHFVRELAAERGSLFAVRRLTLDALAYELALPALARAGRASHSRLGQEAVMARVVHQGLRDNRLGRLKSVADGPGLVRALTSTIQECRLHGVTSEALDALGAEGQVLGHVARAYEALSREHGVADRAHVLAQALDALDAFVGTYVAVPCVLLDVLIETPAEAKLVKALADRAPTVVATVPSGDDVSLRHLIDALGCDAEVLAPEGPPSLLDLQQYLFSEKAPRAREDAPEVTILSAPGEAQEAVEIVRAVQDVASAGTPFDEIAVLLRSPESYTTLLEDAFGRAEIPAHFEGGTTRPDPAGRAFLALMDCAAEELSATRFAEYLSLAQLPKLDAEGVPVPPEDLPEDEDILWVPPKHALAPKTAEALLPVQLDLFAEPEKVAEPEKAVAIEGGLRAPWRWEKLLVDAAVIGSHARWERRLAGLARELEIRLLEVEDRDSAEAETRKRECDDLEHLKRYALPLVEILAQLPTQALWGEWIEALERLATRALTRPEGVLSILEELRPMASVGPVEGMEVRDVLSERLTLLSQRPKDYRYGKVWVAPIDAVRGASFHVVLVPGLAERMFPRKIVEDSLLLDEKRRALGAGLQLSKERASNERLALKLAIGAATKQIVFSYPSVDLKKGRAKVPSFYLLEIARASQGTLPDFETLEREAASSSGARLGWPAPREYERAIDATEFDLAFLAEALRRDAREDDVRGTGRYLVDVNPSLARSLRAKYQRGRTGKFTSVDG
ncbi:MAG: PD-(D/E)XK nuclease family protein, partial [Acidobacteria bacterium]